MEKFKEGMIIRQMLPKDVASVAMVERRVNPSPWSEKQFQAELMNPSSRFDLLFVDGELAAYLCSWKIIDELQIQNIATVPDFQRCGYAAQLLLHVLRWAAKEGVGKVFLEVRISNIAARALYEKFHFTASGIRPKYYTNHEDALLMELDLPPDFDRPN